MYEDISKIFITGTTSGIGKSIGEKFYRADWQVFGCGRNDGYEINGDSYKYFVMDVGRRRNWRNLPFKENELDVMVNNAGILYLDESKRSEKDLINLFRTNLLGVYYGCNFGSRWVKNGGLVVNIASLSGVKAESDFPLYSALKAGVINLTEAYAKKMKSKQVRCVAVSPGLTHTELVDGSPPKELIEKNAWKQQIEPEEIAELIFKMYELPNIYHTNIIIDGGEGLV